MNSSKMAGDLNFSNQVSFDHILEIMSDNLQLQEFFARMFCPAGVSISRRVSGHLPLREQEIKSTNNEPSAD